MTEQQRNRIPRGVVAGISAAVVAAGGVGVWWAMNSSKPTNPPPISQSVQPSMSPPPSPTVEQTAQVYWLRDTGTHLEVVPKTITVATNQPNAVQPNAVLEMAFNSLLAGSTDPALSSTIPQGTKLRGVKVQNDGIHVDLSEEFTSGGGSASMTGRVAQILYTATTLQPGAKVWIDVEGKQLDVLGGEGLELEQPLTRQSFKENFTL
jgi:spore germination protein GerM